MGGTAPRTSRGSPQREPREPQLMEVVGMARSRGPKGPSRGMCLRRVQEESALEKSRRSALGMATRIAGSRVSQAD